MNQLSVVDLKTWLDDPARANPVIVDVREPWEVQTARLEECVFMPMREIPARFEELDADAQTVVLCHHGQRSMQVVYFLAHHGFTNVHNLSGGIDAWSSQVDPSVPLY
jgi:rhodanese-related sulfurtransferase